jgi:hypothetical protein
MQYACSLFRKINQVCQPLAVGPLVCRESAGTKTAHRASVIRQETGEGSTQGMEMTHTWLRMNNFGCGLHWKRTFQKSKMSAVRNLKTKTCFGEEYLTLQEIMEQ